MSGDYLWDKTGDLDPEVQRLEEVLGTLRSQRPAPGLPVRPRRPVLRVWPLLAAAAVVLAALWVTRTPAPRAGEGWEIAWLDGGTWSEARVVRESRVAAGGSIDTGAGRARLLVGAIGEVQLEPSTRIELLDAGQRDHRLALVRGRMHAMIWAPPGRFFVETPSAVAVDLGCRYTLEVEADGAGTLRVDAGWVGIEHDGVVSLVPAGAVADTRKGRGPGTPHYEDAPLSFSEALDQVDFGDAGHARRGALDTVLAEARERDAFSLWHLLTRTEGDDRARVFERLASLVPPPAGVSLEGITRGDRAMLEAWWDRLGLGSAEFWRTWTSGWAER